MSEVVTYDVPTFGIKVHEKVVHGVVHREVVTPLGRFSVDDHEH